MTRGATFKQAKAKNVKGKGAATVARRAIINLAETKFIDTGLTSTTFPNASTASIPTYYQGTSLNLIVKGDGNDQREGSKILITDIKLNLEFILDKNSNTTWSTVVNSDHVLRFVVYIDHQCNQAIAPINYIFDYTLSGNEYQISASRNLEFINRFSILHDETRRLEVPATTWDGTNFHFPGCLLPLSFRRSGLRIPVHFTDNLLNIASVTTKNIGFIVMLSTGSTTQRKITWRSRVNFKDF